MQACIADLPASVREIAEVIGRSAALRLVNAWPSRYRGMPGKKGHRVVVYVPEKLPEQHRLIDILGRETAERLSHHFGNEILQLANCRGLYVKHRDECIRRMLADGAKSQIIQQLLNVSEGQIARIAKEQAIPHKA